MEAVIAVAFLVIVMQLVFSLYQLRYYDRFIKSIASKYASTQGYRLDAETAKRFLKTAIVILVSNEQLEIVEAYQYEGMTIFAKFKVYEKLIDQQINTNLLEELKESEKELTNQAAIKIIEKKL